MASINYEKTAYLVFAVVVAILLLFVTDAAENALTGAVVGVSNNTLADLTIDEVDGKGEITNQSPRDKQNQPKNQQSCGIEFGSAECTSNASAPYPELVIAATICSGGAEQ